MEQKASESNAALLKLVQDINPLFSLSREHQTSGTATLMSGDLALRPAPHAVRTTPFSNTKTAPANGTIGAEMVGSVVAAHSSPAKFDHQGPWSGLQELNLIRSEIGSKEFTNFGKERQAQVVWDEKKVISPPRAELTISWLEVEIVKIADYSRSLAVFAEGRQKFLKDSMSSSIDEWLQAFEHNLNQWAESPNATRAEKQSRQLQAQGLLLALNKAVLSVNGVSRRMMYRALQDAGIDRVFDKLRKVLRSVAIEKEIETFEDDMETLDE